MLLNKETKSNHNSTYYSLPLLNSLLIQYMLTVDKSYVLFKERKKNKTQTVSTKNCLNFSKIRVLGPFAHIE